VTVAEKIATAGKGVSLPAERIDLWVVPSEVDLNERETFWQVLSGAERDRAQRFKFDRDRDRFITVHGILRLILSAYSARPAADLEFPTGPNGKPALTTSERPIEFNMSHSGPHALIGITTGGACGVDIEVIRPGISTTEIAERFFAPAEIHWLRSLPPEETVKGFFRLWTVKEAVIKATGLGLSTPLTDFDTAAIVKNGPAALNAVTAEGRETPLWVSELDVGTGVAAAVAIENGERLIRVLRPAEGLSNSD
jgi:4'-phosphopantetheinyl transferase